jgi:hypothetical protein
MADNKLAPSSRNALMSPPQGLLRETADYPQYGRLVDYLSARRMMPPIYQKPLGSVGEFEYDTWFGKLPRTGVVNISMTGEPSTVVHELTHAADRQLGWQYNELKNKKRRQDLSPVELQFMDAYEKLIYNPGSGFGQKPEANRTKTAKSLAPEWAKQKSGYRATGHELAAFGMGSSVAPNTMNPAPLHVDPTYASEFEVLLDLANRAQQKQPQSQGR